MGRFSEGELQRVVSVEDRPPARDIPVGDDSKYKGARPTNLGFFLLEEEEDV